MVVEMKRVEKSVSTSIQIKKLMDICFEEANIDKTKFKLKFIMSGKPMDMTKRLGGYTSNDCIIHVFKLPKV